MPAYDGVLDLLFITEEIEERRESETLLDELDPAEFSLRRTTWPGRR